MMSIRAASVHSWMVFSIKPINRQGVGHVPHTLTQHKENNYD